MKNLGFLALLLSASTALAATSPYTIDTVVKKSGQTEKMQMILEPNKSGEIAVTDTKSKSGTALNIKAEPVDSDTVLLTYVIKDIQNGKETIVGRPEIMVFLDQSADVSVDRPAGLEDYDLTVTVRRK